MTLVTYVGIDPGATAGLVALKVDESRPGDAAAWRWFSSATLTKPSRKAATRTENALSALFEQARDILNDWQARVVAIERPSDVGMWIGTRGGQGQRGQSTGTAFAVGEAFGMLAAAASSCECRVFDYPVTSRKARPGKPERVGWMPVQRTRGLTHTPRRDLLLNDLHVRSVALRSQPHDGVLRADRATVLDENILMALGVLLFHLSRQHL